jgi:hypothetical protein
MSNIFIGICLGVGGGGMKFRKHFNGSTSYKSLGASALII